MIGCVMYQDISQSSVMIGNVIPLSTLMEFLIQRTYHELIVLSELLQTKNDLDRKIEICKFANRTKQTFVRLLALVKWTNSANKVDKCVRIFSFLQQQQMLFIETADCLARMARETLVHARLPCFSLPCAIDVLTTGTYSRLPFCIKEKIVPPEPLLPTDKKKVLHKLTQVIEYKIVMTDLPHCMCRPVIDNGRVKFTVDHEFEVYLTLMGDAFSLPWRLLNIDILVEDYECKNTRSLVHPQQVAFVHELVQSRLIESEQPLQELYNCLHFFCQSLQLEILYFQSFNLIKEKFGDYIKVDEYNLGKNLIISYWREPGKVLKQFPSGCKLSIYVDEKNSNKPLVVSHTPTILGENGVRCLKEVNISCISMEKLLVHTIQIRCLSKLMELKRELEFISNIRCHITGFPPIMYLSMSEEIEDIVITVDTMRGCFSVSKSNHVNPFIEALEDCINGEKKDVINILSSLRLFEYMAVYRNTLKSYNYDLVDYSQKNAPPHKMFGKNFFTIPFYSTNKYLLIIKFVDKGKLHVKYYLTKVNSSEIILVDLMKIFKPFILNSSRQKRSEEKVSVLLAQKFNTIYLYAEEIILFIGLNNELNVSNVHNSNYLPDQSGVGCSLQILGRNPMLASCNHHMVGLFNSNVLAITFRLVKKDKYSWCVQMTFFENVIQFLPLSNNQYGRCFLKIYDVADVKKVVVSFLSDWDKSFHIFEVLCEMINEYNGWRNISSLPDLFHFESSTYNKLVLSYGQRKQFYVSIEYDNSCNTFQLFLGTHADSLISNPHSVVSAHLRHFLNKSHSLLSFCKILAQTCDVNEQLYKLNSSPLMWTKVNLMSPVQNFTIVAQTLFHFRIFFQSLFCFEFHCINKNLLLVKDCSFLPNNKVQIMDSSTALTGFQAFLKMHSCDQLFENDAFTFANDCNVQSNPGLSINTDGSLLSALQLNIFRCVADKAYQVPSETYISCDAFNKMVSPLNNNVSHLDRYLGAQYFKRHLQRIIKSDENLMQVPTTEPGVFMFKSDLSGLQLKFNANTIVSPIKIFPIQDTMSPSSMSHWDIDDLTSLETFFELKVFSYPFKPTHLEAFCSLLKMHYQLLKDFINIIKLELNPEKNMRWFVQLLLTFPSGFDYNLGVNALVVSRKVMFILQLTWNTAQPSVAETTSVSPPINVILPLCYDYNTNTMQLIENHKQNVSQTSVVANILKRFAEYHVKPNECSIMPSVREIIANLT